jgi:uncharacterized protein (DUF1684 family)/Flp pilus assembly protein TadD
MICSTLVLAMSLALTPSTPAAAPAALLHEGLGKHTRQVSTGSADAQRYFNQGLSFLYAFNHDEAIRSFQEAARLDPGCAMAWWGIAVANGPHINNPVLPAERARAAWEALGRARAAAAGASDVERALIEALGARYADPPPEDRSALDKAYADAMGKVWARFPDDADVGALYAEAMMDLRPWDLWTDRGEPQPGTPEIVSTLERLLAASPDHPLALHLYIHAVEASPEPGKADAAADRLRDLVPGLGHMVHMPSHIDVRRGRWEKAIIANRKAMEADARYRQRSPRQGFYRLYMAHNHHMLGYAAMMLGRSAEAIRVMDEMVAGIPDDWARESGVADGFMAMPIEVRVRFGRWDEVLAAPDLPEHFPLARALRRASRGVAYAATGRLAEARAEQQAFLAAQKAIPESAAFGNNTAAAIASVARHMLDGEILYFEGKVNEAFAALRRAVEEEDRLRYDEPPDWILPVRHALGAALLRSGRAAEAEQVYRDDLGKLPDNGWSLFGLARSLSAQGRHEEAAQAQARFEAVWKTADIQIGSSCLCQPGSPAGPGASSSGGSSYEEEIRSWRQKREERLKSDTGWLTVAGLFWLEPGWNTFGSDPANAIVLPRPAPGRAGMFEFVQGRTRVHFEPNVPATVNGMPIDRPRELRADADGEPDMVQIADLTMFVIRRGERTGIRLRDRNSRMRREFKGLSWYPIDPDWKVQARWEPYDPVKTLPIPNVLGTVEPSPCPGAAVFEVAGRKVRLEPILEEPGAGELFFIFKDATSGKDTYGAGRFLYTPMPKDGAIVLDFNKAYTPPCGFTPFATCPLPPEGNRLAVAIEAGEKFSGH